MSARIGYPCRQCRVSWLQAVNDRSQAWASQAEANRKGMGQAGKSLRIGLMTAGTVLVFAGLYLGGGLW